MLQDEPITIALILGVAGALVILSVLVSRAARPIGIPVALLFLAIGMAAGSQGLGIVFDDYRLAFRLGSVALVLILFDGGINTPLAALRQNLAPAVVLATLGVAATAVIVMFGARLLGVDRGLSWIIGAVVSSTDAAAVFSVLRTSGIRLRKRLGATLELESGLNDPMAVILTFTATQAVASAETVHPEIILEIGLVLLIGIAFGVAVGYGGRFLIQRLHLPVGGLYPVFTVGLAFFAFGIATLFDGSGFLAVYVASIIIGSGRLPYRTGLLRVHDALAWLAQVGMFLVFGLLVVPSDLFEVIVPGVLLGLILAVVARPISVGLVLMPFHFRRKERVYLSWVGLRGAVPIILATVPVLSGIHDSHKIFSLVFFMVVVNAIVPGATVVRLARALGLESKEPPSPAAILEITSTRLLEGDVIRFYVDEASAVSGSLVSELPFPEKASALLLVRGVQLIAPRGSTRLQPGDHVYVFCKPEDFAFVQLIFGRGEES